MKDYFKNYLFTKHILVADEEPKDQFETAVSLSKIYAVKVWKGIELLHPDHMKICEEMIGSKIKVPAPFYKNFPESVKSLTEDQLLFDQLYAYFHWFLLDERYEKRNSIFEQQFERLTFTEDFDYKEFEVLSEKDAIIKLSEIIKDLLASTRPVAEEQIQLIVAFMNNYDYCPGKIASKDVALELLFISRDIRLARFIDLSDVIKLVDKINYYSYDNKKINKLNLKNKDRKFITQVMHEIMDREASISHKTIAECSEKKKAWKGLLHHIHFKPLNVPEKDFVNAIRYHSNSSVYSEVEFWMENNDPRKAADILYIEKGPGAVLRNIEYFISRCNNDDDKRRVLKRVHADANGVLLMQLYLHYCFYNPNKIKPRNFVFTKFNMVKTHTETSKEFKRRKTKLSGADADLIADRIDEMLEEHYADKVKGNVYISPKMVDVALPLQETSSNFGFGALPTGSRVHIPRGKVIRIFTYWNKIDILDLSAMGLNADGSKTNNYNWTNIERWQRPYMVHSGDCCDGYTGGSEFIDLDISGYKKDHPEDKYLVFNLNVWDSRKTFESGDCHAGYMLRDSVQSGDIFEPKTVNTSYSISANSRFAYLFAVDLDKEDLVWLNVVKDSKQILAAVTSFDFLLPYIYRATHLNVYNFFHMTAEHITRRPEDADVIVSDTLIPGIDTEGKEIIHSYDAEKMLKYINL